MTKFPVKRLREEQVNPVLFTTVFTLLLFSTAVFSQKPQPTLNDNTYPTSVYWGDTHLHSSLSVDAFNIASDGNLTPEEIYRFAGGEKITTRNGRQVQLRRPLDFLVVADHAENLGVPTALESFDPLLMKSITGREWSQQWQALQDKPANTEAYYALISKLHLHEDQEIGNQAFRRSVWNEVVEQAERFNAPGKFTAFIGYEWSSRRPYYIHRVVVFRDGGDRTTKILPLSSHEANDPENLWRYMANYEQYTQGQVLAIPHTANLSNGKMFMLQNFQGESFSQEYAKNRSRWEPLLEVTQVKGDSETHPALSPTDEFADYEKFVATLSYQRQQIKTNEQLPYQFEYARSALKLGLQEQARLGVNPFKMGLIGSTDSHNAMSGVEEYNFLGASARYDHLSARGNVADKEHAKIIRASSAAGYAAVWAKENTRQSLFDAMKRKEVYASTGPRINVRFFGGWDYQAEDVHRSNFANMGYKKGVPMGGDLTAAPPSRSPRFLIRAVKDPDGANLDRLQVIKGWRDSTGELFEKIYDVALSDNNKPNSRGKENPTANSGGDPELAVVWEDPDFNKDELAFYYVRVLEVPTPRWTTYDARLFNFKHIPEDVPLLTQERAYTSPIWYSP